MSVIEIDEDKDELIIRMKTCQMNHLYFVSYCMCVACRTQNLSLYNTVLYNGIFQFLG